MAADYLVMAAWLAYLKSRLLLPEPVAPEGESAAEIAEITGLSASNVATKIHRIKKLVHQQYEGEIHERE